MNASERSNYEHMNMISLFGGMAVHVQPCSYLFLFSFFFFVTTILFNIIFDIRLVVFKNLVKFLISTIRKIYPLMPVLSGPNGYRFVIQ